ncbi:MAG: malate synthase G, partial [Pseudomonadota bacterium]
MTDRVEIEGLQVDVRLAEFVDEGALPGTGVAAGAFWSALSALIHELGPKNRALLAKRADLQAKIDDWHRENRDHDPASYKAFLDEIGYLVPEGGDFTIETEGVDEEIASIPGPQLVVPVMNARYALNAANARWGSLYDALYGTDAMGDLPSGGAYDPERGARVVSYAKGILDEIAPLAEGSHRDATGYVVRGGALVVLRGDEDTVLADAAAFAGYAGAAGAPTAILLKHNGLHAEISIDAAHRIGEGDPAHVADVRLEAAVSTIMDCEDSIAAVDAEDKVAAYANWLGLNRGDLEEVVEKGGLSFTRSLAPDRDYFAPDGSSLTLKGRSLLLVRNVGHLMTTPAVLDRDGAEAGEGLLD